MYNACQRRHLQVVVRDLIPRPRPRPRPLLELLEGRPREERPTALTELISSLLNLSIPPLNLPTPIRNPFSRFLADNSEGSSNSFLIVG